MKCADCRVELAVGEGVQMQSLGVVPIAVPMCETCAARRQKLLVTLRLAPEVAQ